jgi:K+-transporting ATPase ATPase C chain
VAELRTALLVLIALTVITGGAYPLVVTGLAQLLLRSQANGSLIVEDGRPRGSALVGQPFDDPRWFWSRPSATGRFPYDAAASSGSNQGPTSDALLEAVQSRAAALRAADPGNPAPIPADLVTASGSGLDPHVSPAAARYQAARVARVRGLERASVDALVEEHTEGRWLGLLGEPRVNVLALNLALDRRAPR